MPCPALCLVWAPETVGPHPARRTPSHLEVPVGLKPYAEWPVGVDKAAFVRMLNERFAKMPGFDVGISQPIIDGVNDAVGGAHSPLVLRIYAEDLKEGRRIGERIVEVLHGVRGTASASLLSVAHVGGWIAATSGNAAANVVRFWATTA